MTGKKHILAIEDGNSLLGEHTDNLRKDGYQVTVASSPINAISHQKKRVFDLAPGGGFVFSSIHNIQTGVPPQNIVTMFKSVTEFGRYPIQA